MKEYKASDVEIIRTIRRDNMKEYKAPDMEIIRLLSEDVITASNFQWETTVDPNVEGVWADIYD